MDWNFWIQKPLSYLGQEPRLLGDDDYDEIFANTYPVRERKRKDIQTTIRESNPIRWARLQRDYRWVQRRMKKMGLNPEDARWIL